MTKKTHAEKRAFVAGVLAVGAVAVAAVPAMAYTGQQYAKDAKVSLSQAEAIAAQAVPGGKIADRELEKESGGSGLRYSFDVTVNGKTREIGVDAKTGKVLENSADGADSD